MTILLTGPRMDSHAGHAVLPGSRPRLDAVAWGHTFLALLRATLIALAAIVVLLGPTATRAHATQAGAWRDAPPPHAAPPSPRRTFRPEF